MKKNKYLSKKLIFFLFFPTVIFAQIGINLDNSAPSTNAMLDVKSSTKGILIPRVGSDLASPTEGLLYYNTTGHNFRYYDGTAWQNTLFGNQWNVNGTKISYSAGNVGIGIADPAYKLDVVGNSRFTGWVAINDPDPSYPLDVNGLGSIQYLGLGGAAPNTTNSLEVNGNAEFNNTLHVDGATTLDGGVNMLSTANITGAATVNGNKGVAYNVNSSTNLKIHRFTTLNILPILGAHGLSPEFEIGFSGGFTSTPTVFVGDIDSMGGAPPEFYGQLYMLKLQVYGCDTNSCKARVVNLDNASLKYNVIWNMMAVGY